MHEIVYSLNWIQFNSRDLFILIVCAHCLRDKGGKVSIGFEGEGSLLAMRQAVIGTIKAHLLKIAGEGGGDEVR